MKKLAVFLISIFLILGFATVHAQMKTQTPAQVKPNIPSKTYWCAEVKDILFSKEPQQGQKLSVGVRVKFRKMTIIPGAPGPKLCNCAFEGPSGNLAKVWTKTMSLRLIGIKYSETETNLLEYYGPTPAFRAYDYSGFPVIGFVVTENDLKKGYKDVWGWASTEPLQCRDAKIYATLDVNGYALKGDNDPDYLKKGCFPSGDYVKSFKPKCLQVPKIPEGAIKEGVEKTKTPVKSESPAETKTLPKLPEAAYSSKKILRIPAEKFFIEKKFPIKFIPLDRSYFKIPVEQKTITLKEKTIMVNGKPLLVRKAKTIDVEKFLKEVNAIEEWLNGLGYTLKDKEPIKIKYVYPKEQFKLQREMLSKDFLKKVTIPSPPQVTCEGYSEGYDASSSGPKDFVPLDWEKNWNASFGNDDFGVNLAASMKIKGDKGKNNQNTIDIIPFLDAEVTLFGENIDVLKIDKQNDTLILKAVGIDKEEIVLCADINKEIFNKGVAWSTEIEFPVGPINIVGEIGFKGKAKLSFLGRICSLEPYANGILSPSLSANAYAELGASYEIVSVGVGGELTLIKWNPSLTGQLELTNSNPPYFKYSVIGENNMTLLAGRLYIWGEIDYWIDSKKVEIELYNFDGFTFDQPRFAYKNISVPAERDHKVWLKINKITGITPYTARNEKLDIVPVSYDLIVDIDGRTYTKTLKDYNKDGIWGNAIGEYEDQIFEIPLLSYKKVPISIEVIEKYKIGTLEFKNTLDFAPGIWNKVELCYDPGKRTFIGTKSGKEDEEITSVGDTSYWGERHHGISFEIGQLQFKPAPSKAK
ncbi:hypothetical protein [Thermodesulfovibrio sp. 3462-1]|uniref:Uncharacterized protein n=1 Tax=Thermodesulfovibrio obliviosus TaxID=3118332 RepID=A0AAU8H100_9BACT